ncbi:MAG TPA: TraR/DksA family transcriptional regulator [Candidatus Acidoferrales bacterium]|nr:TraR/DksA family transcriptional regulator [Candidatus Acidoferrales bacterium]
MTTVTKGRNRKYANLEKMLQQMRSDLRSRLSIRLGEVTVETEPDDEGAQASYSFTTDLAVATLERERRTLEEVNAALERIKSGEYGSCVLCNSPIPEARLRALPWARMCVQCAGRTSGSGSMAAD